MSEPDPDWYFDHVLYFATPGGGPVTLGPAAEWQAWWRSRAREIAHTAVGRLAARQGFVVTTRQLADCDVSRGYVRGQVRRGAWTMPHRGIVAVVGAADGGDDGEHVIARRRHAIGCAAVMLANPGHAVSGPSAAVMRGLPTGAVPPAPGLTVLAGRPRRRTGAREAALAADDVDDWFGVAVTRPARTVVDLARHDRRDGLMAADAALRERLCGVDDLAAALRQAQGWPGVTAARTVVGLASPLAESPLESVVRLAAHDEGLPLPELQAEIAVPGRRRPFRVDMLWRAQRVVVEADGRAKYTGDELWREKRREDLLREAGYRVIRIVWSDVTRDWPAAAVRLRAALLG